MNERAKSFKEAHQTRIDALTVAFLREKNAGGPPANLEGLTSKSSVDLSFGSDVELQIDVDTAKARSMFLREFEVADDAGIKNLSGLSASGFVSARKIVGLPFDGKHLYPTCQFGGDGQPYPLLKTVLAAIPQNLDHWQVAFWLVSETEELGGRSPISEIRRNNPEVVTVASTAFSAFEV